MNSEQPDAGRMELWPDRGLAVESNILIIAVRPGEESHLYGGLIAELCRRGRPPFVTILTDGSDGAGTEAETVAAQLGAAARRAVGHLGLPAERLLLIGLHDGASAGGTAITDALVSAYDLLSWARDCQTVCVAGNAAMSADHELARGLGERLSIRAGLGCVLSFGGALTLPDLPPLDPGRIDIRRHLAAKERAQAEYPAAIGPEARDRPPYEYFAVLPAPVESSRFWAPHL